MLDEYIRLDKTTTPPWRTAAIPFLVKTTSESHKDFVTRAHRDAGIIKRFCMKFTPEPLEPLAASVHDALSVHIEVFSEVAMLSGHFAIDDDEMSINAILVKVVEECLGNVPANHSCRRTPGKQTQLDLPASVYVPTKRRRAKNFSVKYWLNPIHDSALVTD